MPFSSLHIPCPSTFAHTQMQLLPYSTPALWDPRQGYEAGLLRTKAFRERDDLLRRQSGFPPPRAGRELRRAFPGRAVWPYTPEMVDSSGRDHMHHGPLGEGRMGDFDYAMGSEHGGGFHVGGGHGHGHGHHGGSDNWPYPFPPPPIWIAALGQKGVDEYIDENLKRVVKAVCGRPKTGGGGGGHHGCGQDIDIGSVEERVRKAVGEVFSEQHIGNGSRNGIGSGSVDGWERAQAHSGGGRRTTSSRNRSCDCSNRRDQGGRREHSVREGYEDLFEDDVRDIWGYTTHGGERRR